MVHCCTEVLLLAHLGKLEQLTMSLGLVHRQRHLAHLARLLHELRAVQGQESHSEGLQTTQRDSDATKHMHAT